MNKDESKDDKVIQEFEAKAEKVIKTLSAVHGFVIYFTSQTKLSGTLVLIHRYMKEGFTLRINKQQSIYLSEPAFYLFGKPCWIVIRGIPYSCNINLLNLKDYLKDLGVNQKELEKLPDNKFEILKDTEGSLEISNDGFQFVNVGYSAVDLDAMNFSQTINALVRKPKLDINVVLYQFLITICACLIEYVIISLYVKEWI